MKVIGLIIISMELENIFMLMGIFMKVSLRSARLKVLDYSQKKLVLFFKVIGKIISFMEKGKKFGMTEFAMKEIMFKESNMV
jgi:hypothetical protein